jgi:hypothetical protein
MGLVDRGSQEAAMPERPNPKPDDVTVEGAPEGLPSDETELETSLTPTEAATDPVTAEEISRRIDSDPALSPVAEQPGAASISNLPNRRDRDWKV